MSHFWLAVFLPWIVGYFNLISFNRRNDIPPLPFTLLLGYGYLLGLFGITLLLRIWDACGLPLAFKPLAGLLIGSSLIALIANRAQLRFFKRIPHFYLDLSSIIFLIMLLGLALHLWLLGNEVWLRPLFPWDAWSAWAQKTATWFELRQLVPFVDPTRWPGTESSPQFTAPAFAYPPTIPLIQVWTLLGLGQWDDSKMNLPWLCCWIALGLGFYGQCRYWGITPLMALLGVYGLLTLPLLETHVALAGYADLWLATSYGFALMAILQWLRTQEQRHLILALFCALIATQLKNEGIVWAFTLIPALLLGLKRYWVLGLLGGLTLGLSAWVYWIAPLNLTFLGLGSFMIQGQQLYLPGLGAIALDYHPVGIPLLQHLFAFGNWHLFWYFVLLSLLFGLTRLKNNAVLRIAYLTLVIDAGWVLGMFFFTDLGRWAEQATALNRVILHAVPGIMFVSMASLIKTDDQTPTRL